MPPFHLPLSQADQWGAGPGERAATGWAQSAGGDSWLVLGSGLRHLPDRLHGREDQTEHAPGTEVLTEDLTEDTWGVRGHPYLD